jgi:ABC-type branched-subunit amino acid transport system ATPase component
MKLLHYIEIENFKGFVGRQRIELDHPAVLIGPNNCGKTTVIQAIALWCQAVKTWCGSSAKSGSVSLNRLGIVNVPVERTRYFWNGAKVRTGNKDIPLTITVGVEFEGRVEPVAMSFRNQGEDLVYCKMGEGTRSSGLIKHLQALNVELLYPMSGLEIEEAVLQPGRIGVLLGQGQTAQVLRNLCLMVLYQSRDDWGTIVKLMHRLFQMRLGDPRENSRGAIDLTYTHDGSNVPLFLSASGRGFQQMLLILAYLYSHKGSVLLVDEPDAHLEILRQKQIFRLLRDIAGENRSQVVMVTHSEVIMNEALALETKLTVLGGGRTDNLSTKAAIVEALPTSKS